MSRSSLLRATLLAALCAGGAEAQAATYGTVTGYYTGFSPYHGTNGTTVYGDGPGVGGGFNFHVTATNPDSGVNLGFGAPNDLLTFCVEVHQNIRVPSSTSTPYVYAVADLKDAPFGSDTPMGQQGADLINDLYAHYYGLLPSSGTSFAADFQTAVWILEYDHAGFVALSSSFTKGNVLGLGPAPIGGTISDNLYNMLKTVYNDYNHINGGALQTLQNAIVFALISPSAAEGVTGALQDQIVVLPGATIPHIPTPEPASLLVWGAYGLVALGASRRRKAI